MLATLAVILLALTSLVLLVTRDWRWSIAAMAVLYLAVMALVAGSWPIGMALIKLVVGWMSGVALGLTQVGQQDRRSDEWSWTSSRFFRLLAGGMILLAIIPIAPLAASWLPGIELQQAWGGLILIGIGLIQLGMTAQPLRVVIGLLCVLAGFEVMYAAVEYSELVAGLLAGVNLGLALAGAYLLSISAPTEQPSAVEDLG